MVTILYISFICNLYRKIGIKCTSVLIHIYLLDKDDLLDDRDNLIKDQNTNTYIKQMTLCHKCKSEIEAKIYLGSLLPVFQRLRFVAVE